MTKATEQAKRAEEARQHILKLVKPGATLYTVLNHVSRSGMYRAISVYAIVEGEPVWLNGWADAVLEWGRDRKHDDGIKCSGAGMDMGFHLVYSLASYLWPDGFDCSGDKCPSNDHVNARRGTCPICGAHITDPEPVRGCYDLSERPSHEGDNRGCYDLPRYTRNNRGWDWPACSQACAAATWHHRDGGYAVNHKWM